MFFKMRKYSKIVTDKIVTILEDNAHVSEVATGRRDVVLPQEYVKMFS